MKTILVPTDFSSNANNALRYADSLALAMNAKLIVLNIYTPSLGRYNMMGGIVAEEIAIAKTESLQQLTKSCENFANASCSTMFEIGSPVNEIIGTAKKKNPAFIVMGTHGASGLNKVLFGSNTSKVISKSEIPVLAIPQRYKFRKIKKIICTSDFKNLTSELKSILPIAKAMDTAIELLYLDYGWDKSMNIEQRFNDVIKKCRYKNIQLVQKKVSIEEPIVEHLKKYAKKNNDSILVMFPEDKSYFDKLFLSSKTEELAYNLKLPLLTIRKSSIKKNKK